MRFDRLRAVREMRGWTQDDLARQSGISLQQIWRYETGRSEPTADAAIRLARVLDCSLDYLAGMTDEVDGARDLSEEEVELIAARRAPGTRVEKIRRLLQTALRVTGK